MSDQALLITWIVGFIVTAWATARYAWRDGAYDSDPYLMDYLAPFLMGLLWPIVLVAGTVAGVIWLFIQSAKPGRVRLPKRKPRASLEARIAELEAGLGMREGR